MALLIDGYNLLHATGIEGPARGARAFQSARNAFLRFLARRLGPDECAQATVVFDAQSAPPGLPRELVVQGIHVRFAAGFASADELIEELIRKDTAPRRLTVVSSDHRVQRAARRRGAAAIDSDAWLVTFRHSQPRPDTDQPLRDDEFKPTPEEDEVQRWLEEFAIDEPPPGDPPAGLPPAGKTKNGFDLDELDDVFPPDFGREMDDSP